jgi:ABC-type Fe3+ transport system substrate-binding protein
LHVATRVLAERRAEKYLADVVVTGPGTPYYVLHKANALDPIKSAFVLPEVVDESGWWQRKHHFVDSEGKYVFVFIGPVSRGSVYYNTKLVNAAQFKSYWDLLNPRWRGKLLLIDPRAPGAARLGLREIFHMPELGTKFLRRLFGEMDIVLTRDARQAADWLAVGRFPVCLFCSGARDAKAQGLPVDEFKTTQWLEAPTISPGGTSTVVLVNRAPHPNAARVFINWLLSREGQDTFQKVMNRLDNLFESMRIDIPKEPVPVEYRRKEGINYLMMATAERADHAPVEKLLNEILK